MPAHYTPEEWTEHLQTGAALFARREPFVCIMDTRGGQAPSAAQRREATAFYERYEAEYRAYLKGTAGIVDSAIIRGVLTALTWVKRMPFPYTYVATEEEARCWVEERLRAATDST